MRKFLLLGLAALLFSSGCAIGGLRALPTTLEASLSPFAPAAVQPNPTPTMSSTVSVLPTAPPATATPGPSTPGMSTPTPAPSRSSAPVVSSGGDPSEWVSSNKGLPTFPRCSVATWLYLPEGQPASATTASVLTDIVEGLRRISFETGLKFQQSEDRSLIGKPNVIVYKWSSALGEPAGQGSYTITTSGGKSTVTGYVAANAEHWWTSDAYAGFSIVNGPNGRSTGRGWLFVHETMHVLGMGHVDSPYEIMSATLPDLTALGPGDRNGLVTLYAPENCPPS